MQSQEQYDRQDQAAHAQIRGVQNQSDAYRALDAKIKAAAGYDEAADTWKNREPLPLRIRVKSTGAELEIGFEHARNLIHKGTAELA